MCSRTTWTTQPASPIASGRLVAQGLTLPGHLGSMPTALAVIKRFDRDDMDAERVHSQRSLRRRDASPRYLHVQAGVHRRRADGVCCTMCHHTDVGGRVCRFECVGLDRVSMPRACESHREDLCRGRRNEMLLALIRCNVRLPDKVLGDLRAQLAACHLGERQFRELVARFATAQPRPTDAGDRRLC